MSSDTMRDGIEDAGYAAGLVIVAALLAVPAGRLLALVTGLAAGLVLSVRRERWLAVVLLGGLLARVLVILVDAKLGILPGPPIESGHHQRALTVAAAWTQGQFLGVHPGLDSLRRFVAYTVAPAQILFGDSLAAARTVIAIAGLGVGYLTYAIATELADHRTGLYAATFTLFWPSVFYRSVVVQREVLVVVALLTLVLIGLRWTEALTLRAVLPAAIGCWVIYVLRAENLVLVAAVLGAILLVRGRDHARYLAALVVTVLPFLAYFVVNIGSFTGFTGSLSPELIDRFAYARAHGDATYLVGYHYDSWLDIIGFLPVKTLYFLFAPFPWQISSFGGALAGVSGSALLISALFWRRGIARLADEWKQLLVVAAYLSVGIAAYSIIEMNFGAAFRRRIQFVPLLLVLVAAGLSHVRIRIRTAEQAEQRIPDASEESITSDD